MDSFLGIGLPELILILLLAGIVMGPHRIRDVARTFGRITVQLQSVSREFVRQLNVELDSLDEGEMKGTVSDVRRLQKEIDALRRELRDAPRALVREGEKAVKEAKEALDVEAPAAQPDGAANEQPEEAKPAAEPTAKPAATSADGGRTLPKLLEVPDDPE